MTKNNYQYDTMVQDVALPSIVGANAVGPDTAPLLTRLRARAAAARLDREVVAGNVPTPGSPLEVHVARLTSVRERESIARAFRRMLTVTGTNSRALLRVPIVSHQINGSSGLIDDITMRLHSPRPVHAEGMARLRVLLSDGTGPLYCDGGASLAVELRAALQAL